MSIGEGGLISSGSWVRRQGLLGSSHECYGVGDEHGHPMAKDGDEQPLSSQWHMPKLRFLLWRDSHNRRKMKQVAF
jgi:hypothetical protein